MLILDSTWEIIDVASVQQQVSIARVAQRWQVAGQRHAGSHVAPYTACGRNRPHRRVMGRPGLGDGDIHKAQRMRGKTGQR